MKSISHLCRPLCNDASPPRVPRSTCRAFSLVEVTLALGLVTFVLVAVLGTVPVALSSGRQSFDQNRASAIADSLFASFRGESFSNVCYLDSQFQGDGATALPGVGLDLNKLTTTSAPQQFYASFLDANVPSSGDSSDAQRKLTFTATGGSVPPGTSYLVALYFNNKPAGMTLPVSTDASKDGDPASGSTLPAQANQIEMVVSPVGEPATRYHFVSTIANRL